MTEKRVSDLSATKEIFDSAKGHYEEALQKSGFDKELHFKPSEPNRAKRRNRQRKKIYFNPPFSKNVKTKVAEEFLKLIDKHFHVRHKYRKLFNRNNLKVSYSTMPNMSKIINGHNQKVLKDEVSTEERSCNCRNPNECPLNGNCLTKEVFYKLLSHLTFPCMEKRSTMG